MTCSSSHLSVFFSVHFLGFNCFLGLQFNSLAVVMITKKKVSYPENKDFKAVKLQ